MTFNNTIILHFCLILFVLNLCGLVKARLESPCPNIFQYMYDNKVLLGIIQVKSPNAKVLELKVQLSVANHNGDDGKIILYDPKQGLIDFYNRRPVSYIVKFPPQWSIPPVVTRISVNDVVVCSGPALDGRRVNKISLIDLRHRLNLEVKHPRASAYVHPNGNTGKNKEQTVDQTAYQEAHVCGRDKSMSEHVQQLLAYGKEDNGIYPWLVAIYRTETSGLNFTCGGSLVSHKHIITAAHCFESPDLHQYVYQMGVSKLTNWQKSILYEASDVIIHPEYLPKSSNADLAVVILRKNIHINKNVIPICWWPRELYNMDITGKIGRVAGWGLDENNQLTTANPKIVDLPVVNTDDCIRSHRQYYTDSKVTQNSICAGTRNGAGPCRGDSGSGLMILYNGRWRLRGVVSITIMDGIKECSQLRNYAVFTDITKYSNWLSKILSPKKQS